MLSIFGPYTREAAIAVWAAVVVGYATIKSGGFRTSAASFLRIVFGSVFLTGLIAGAVAYTVGVVIALRAIGYWDHEMERTTVLWFLGTAVVTSFSTTRKDGRYFRRLVLRNLSIAAVIDYFVNIHPFPFYVWFIIVPVAALLGGVEALLERDPQGARALKLTRGLQTLGGLIVISLSFAYVVRHFGSLATVEKGKDFLLPLLLTVCFLPFLYVVALFTVYQTMLHMIRFGLRGNDHLYRFTRRSIIRTCGPHLGKAQLFESEFRGRLWGAASETDVSRVTDDFRAEWRRGRRPTVEAESPPGF
jgi:hypothetical protein